MSIELSNPYQGAILEQSIKIEMYKKLGELAPKYTIIRFSGPVISVVSPLISLVSRIVSLAEQLIKGSVNIIGSPFSKNCNFFHGVMMLRNFPHNVIEIAFTPIDAIFGFPITSLSIAIHPKEYAIRRENVHRERYEAIKEYAAKITKKVQTRS